MLDMKKNKWKDVITCISLTKCGMSAKQTFGTMILFVVIGIAFEMMLVLGVRNRIISLWSDFGALFLYCAAMYPGQLLMTLDISGMVQASRYKKVIQTSAVSFVSLCGNLGALAILLLVRVLGAHIMPERADLIWGTLPIVGIMGLGLSIMGVLMYKFYIVSILVLTGVYGLSGGLMGYQNGMGMEGGILPAMPLPAAIAFCIAMIFLGCGIQYLTARAIYKRPFSKLAFGNAVGKKFV